MDFLNAPDTLEHWSEISASLNKVVEKWKPEVRYSWDLPYFETIEDIKKVMEAYGYEYLETDGGWSTPLELAILLFTNEDPTKTLQHPVLVLIHWNIEKNDEGENIEWLRTVQVVHVE